MGLNDTPNSNRIHIAFFGKRNAGKSSLMNAVCGQEVSIVSDMKGTTTDPVSKAMELLPVGPVLLIDTPGLDDEGTVGELRIKKARQTLRKTDIAVLVTNGALTDIEEELIETCKSRNVPYLIAYNKCDLYTPEISAENEIAVSAVSGRNITELKELIAAAAKKGENEKRIVGDILSPNDTVVLVTPIDSSAPKGRMILPQVQSIRDILDSAAVCLVTQTDQLAFALESLKNPPRLVITDSQAFGTVKNIVPEEIPLTSFSILFARFKGFLSTAAKGAAAVDRLRDGDTVLICEGCTHHRQCEDIGTVKLPNRIRKHTEKELNFEFTSGGTFPDVLSKDKYALIIHCGACMLNEKEVQYRMRCAEDAGIPFTNYGTIIAYMNSILERSLNGIGMSLNSLVNEEL